MADLVIRVTPIMSTLFRRRGVFSELQAPVDFDGAIQIVVAKDRAIELLRDAQSQVELARRSEKKALTHFVKQLEGVLETPEHLCRARLAGEREAARQRSGAWRDDLCTSEMGAWVWRVSSIEPRQDLALLRQFGIVAGYRIPPSRHREVAMLLDRLDEIYAEQVDASTLDATDALLDRVRRRS